MKLSKELREELDWWQHHLAHWNGRTVIQRQAQSDASLTGWGAVCDGVSTGGSWSPHGSKQCTSTAGYRFSNEGLSGGTTWDFSLAATGQLHGSGIHQQPWGDCVISSHLSSKVSMAMGPRKRHYPHSPAYTGGV